MSESGPVSNPLNLPAWQKLQQLAARKEHLSLPDLLSREDRDQSLIHELGDFYCDFSRLHVDGEVLDALMQLADEAGLKKRIDDLFNGVHVNQSEQRAALHTALRGSSDDPDINKLVQEQKAGFLSFADAVREGMHTGHSGRRIRRVINIGIGGSDLGPRLITSALSSADEPVEVLYVAAVDGLELKAALHDADPDETLFIICSKTFTTLETRTNADAARAWLLSSLPETAVASHFVAVSVNDAAMDEFGIAPENRFRIWDWVGGRYSLWSAVGLAAAISLGRQRFEELLAGSAHMDKHFRETPAAMNLPVLAGLFGVWEQNFLHARQHIVLPYDQRLELLPAYLQQLFMESEGKGVRQDGSAVDYHTGASLWGGPGSNAQHSFAQWLHQGTGNVHVDYIGVVNGPDGASKQPFTHALGNMLAQSEALARGRTLSEVEQELTANGFDQQGITKLAPQKVHPGNRASIILLLRQLDARSLGMLLAYYEHQVYVKSVVWGINPFDQWGVELGKQRASYISEKLFRSDSEGLPAAGRKVLKWQD